MIYGIKLTGTVSYRSELNLESESFKLQTKHYEILSEVIEKVLKHKLNDDLICNYYLKGQIYLQCNYCKIVRKPFNFYLDVNSIFEFKNTIDFVLDNSDEENIDYISGEIVESGICLCPTCNKLYEYEYCELGY